MADVCLLPQRPFVALGWVSLAGYTSAEPASVSSTRHSELIEPTTNYSSLVNNFQARVLERRWEPVPAHDSVLNMKVLDAVRKSAETGRKIKI
jgi:hypothetical protein